MEASTLEEILDNNLPKAQTIDFLSIDVEGLDFNVLKSANIEKYYPKVILVEMLNNSLTDIQVDEIYKFLTGAGYELYSKAVNTVFFKHKDFI
jgi:hypothetical protein